MNHFTVGDVLEFRGRSLKGKDRIWEHGAHWQVVEIRDFFGHIALLLDTVKPYDYRRWWHIEDDQDFELVH